MTLKQTLAQTTRPTASLVATMSKSFERLGAARSLVFVTGLLLLGACSDAVTAPEQAIDRVAAARVMPSVTDARFRLALAIDNAAVRTRVIHDLGELEGALANGDGQKSRFHLHVVGSLLTEYRSQLGSSTTDGADVTAIELALYAVSNVINGRFDLPALP